MKKYHQGLYKQLKMGSFNKVNINAPRYGNIGKVEEIRNLLLEYDPLLVCIQEISVSTAIRVFA